MEEQDKRPESGEYQDNLFDWLNWAGYALAFLYIEFGPGVGQSGELQVPALFAALVAASYAMVTKISLMVSGIDKSSGVALALSVVSWCWFFYWIYAKGLLLPAFVGHLLFLGTVGKVLVLLGWMKEGRRR